MITQDDIDAMKPEKPTKFDYLNDPVFQQMQFYVRLAFEEGYNSNRLWSWRDGWLNSQSRKFLLDSGLITGKEGYK